MAFEGRSHRSASAPAPWGWALLGAVVGLAATLVFFAPAAWLAAALPELSRGRVLLQDARGTVWTGSGRLLFAGGSGSRDFSALPGRLSWRLRPTWAGAGWAGGNLPGIMATVAADCCAAVPISGRLRFGWQSQAFELNNAVVQLPAALLAGLGTPFNTLQAQGSLRLSTQQLVLQRFDGRLAFAGSAQLQALDMSSRLSTVAPMGSYQLVFSGGPAPSLALTTLSGALKLNGSGNWVGERLRFSGVATVEPELLGAFTNLLNIIGRRQGAQSIITLG